MKWRDRKPPKPPKPPKAVRRASWRTRVARTLGLLLCVAGFAAIAVGWMGAARKTCVDCQIPYLISGGAAGIALVALGTGLLLMAQVRTEARRLSAALDHMTWTLAERFMSVPAGSVEDAPLTGSIESVAAGETTEGVPPGEPAAAEPNLVRSWSDRDRHDPDLAAGA